MKRLYEWFLHNYLTVFTLFLLVFIPLYPKLPLIGVIRTWVYIRLEDFLVAAAIGIFLLKQIRERAWPQSPLTLPVIAYWIVGVFVLLNSIFFIGPTITGFFPHLAILHYVRRIEYMMLFFIAFQAFTKKAKTAKVFTDILAISTLAIIIYGIGQKLLGFPAFLTMNEEFAKGVPLRLPPTARITSTFGGHYDLAAYLVFVIPILGSMVFGAKGIVKKLIFLGLAFGSLVLLLLTASRISFGVYLVAITAMLFWQKKRLLIIPVVIGSIVLLNFVSGASERFYKTLRYSDVIVDLSTGQPVGTLSKIEGGSALVEKIASPAEENLPRGSGFISVPTAGSTASNKSLKTIEVLTANELATGSGEIATISGSFLIQKALVYDISVTTRLQGQWPKAIEAFKRNLLLGSGFSTLSLAADGDYMRLLGETGIAGTVAFLGIFILAFALFLKNKQYLEWENHAFVVGVFAGTVGLLCNALLIDVFEASKVAFTFWIVLGAAVAILAGAHKWTMKYSSLLIKTFTHPFAWAVYISTFAFALYTKGLNGYFLGDDFTWLRWAAESTSKDIVRFFTDSSGFFYRPLPKLFYFLLYSVFWLKPTAYHVVSILLFSLITVLIYAISVRLGVRRFLSIIGAVVFATLSVHHESVYWVSGMSSLLAGSFLYGSIAVYQLAWERARRSFWLWIAAFVLLFGSMLSYDGMIVAPILIVFIGWGIYRKRGLHVFAPLVLIPLYWGMRLGAHALFPSGDYGVNTSKLIVNTIGNSVGYIVVILFGPRTIESLDWLRMVLRTHVALVGVVSIICIGALSFLIWRTRKMVGGYADKSLVWFICCLVSLTAYVGLGGIAERYALIASGFLMLSLVSMIDRIWKESAMLWKGTMVCVLAGLAIWNILELERLAGDWTKASNISQYTVLTMKKSYFPLVMPRAFVFVNTPIRYGRAWVFPTGLNDALWHMFKFNQFPYKAITVSSIEEGLAQPADPGYRDVFIFDDYKLKRVDKQIKTVENDQKP